MAAGALDDALRSTPGFTLFRRSSSRVANPTTQGVTLRGVSGSGASRTLVLADGVPLERSVRQLGLLEPHPARRGRSRGSRARRDRRSLRRRRAGRRDAAADGAAEPHARAGDDRRRIARHVPRLVVRGGGEERLERERRLRRRPHRRRVRPRPRSARRRRHARRQRLQDRLRDRSASAATTGTSTRAAPAMRRSAATAPSCRSTPPTGSSSRSTSAAFVGGGVFELHGVGSSQDYYQTFSAVAAPAAPPSG